MTFICILNPAVGSTVTVSGVTPSGYNGRWYVLTSSPTSFTAWNMNTGLGVGTVFGTAAVPMMQDDDVFINLGGSAVSPNFTLQTAIGMVNQSCYIKNTSATSTWTLVPDNSETINGSAGFTLGPGAEVSIQSQLVSTSGAGANWITLGTEAIPTFSPAADSYSGPQSVPELP